jgi:hypothetical protein
MSLSLGDVGNDLVCGTSSQPIINEFDPWRLKRIDLQQDNWELNEVEGRPGTGNTLPLRFVHEIEAGLSGPIQEFKTQRSTFGKTRGQKKR